VDLGEGFFVQDDLDGVGDVEADDFGEYGARVGEECVAEGRIGGDALSDDRLDLRARGPLHSLGADHGAAAIGPACASGDEFELGFAECLAGGDGEVDLGQGFLVQDDLDALGDVESDDLGQHGARVGQQGVAEGGVGGDALSR
jgi:hypothetical protein